MLALPDMSETKATVASAKLRLLSLYTDLPASVRARATAGLIAKLAGPYWQTTSEMWKIDSLQISASVRKMISDDAAEADVIIIAISSWTQSEPVLGQWINSLEAGRNCNQHHPFSGLLVGLLGDEETKTDDVHFAVKPFTRFAHTAHRDFLPHRVETGALNESGLLADKVSRLLSRKLWFDVFGKAFRKLASPPTPSVLQTRHQRDIPKRPVLKMDDVSKLKKPVRRRA